MHTNFEDFPDWFLIEGDYRHLDKKIININDDNRELTSLLYTDEGTYKEAPFDLTEAMNKLLSGELLVSVIQTGFAQNVIIDLDKLNEELEKEKYLSTGHLTNLQIRGKWGRGGSIFQQIQISSIKAHKEFES